MPEPATPPPRDLRSTRAHPLSRHPRPIPLRFDPVTADAVPALADLMCAAFEQGAGRGHVGCLKVAVERQREGFGRRILAEMRARLPEVTTWTLETPEHATSNHRFYESCGFVHAGDRPGDPETGEPAQRQYRWIVGR
ncbi:GNAT family N-acetyltransferase [Cellulomonas denverensis]|uniref:GNAT family N-acetyltransferase n=1 Tax=Cellulomonas denverensis TaxID=264297 RepID=A0A7X6QXW8_9CELL|nr:GNAT family N-acetyltransferase [Cellulomonas denverensis]NKY21505.1 GNAT family N-acetyltransferase [Cellulomonas denverensis]GIG27017.1 hypothetical protein Cde04nite_32610 [Cellulomonas denverensis]